MHNDQRTVTLVVRPTAEEGRNWNLSSYSPSRIIFVDAFTVLQVALDREWHERARDVERIVIDGAGGPLHYLELLSNLSSEFVGDVLFVRADGSAFLSAMGRGGDRVLYSLRAEDVSFYLETKELVYKEAEQLQHAETCTGTSATSRKTA